MLVRGDGAVAAEGRVENYICGRRHPALDHRRGRHHRSHHRLRRRRCERDRHATLAADAGAAAGDEADRRGVADPLSAVLITAKPGENFFAAANCDHLLAIFDGRRRYDLALSYGRIDKLTARGKLCRSGAGVRRRAAAIAGYRPDSPLVKYVAGRRDMELWFAPIPGTALMAPIRVAMPTLIGTLKRIQADRFDAAPVLPQARPVAPVH